MWFEILPCCAIIFVGLALPHAAAYPLNKLLLGNYYRRNLSTRNNRLGYLRDYHLAGDPYTMIGLEAIPDAVDENKA